MSDDRIDECKTFLPTINSKKKLPRGTVYSLDPVTDFAHVILNMAAAFSQGWKISKCQAESGLINT